MSRWPEMTPAGRFWSHVQKSEGCWLWQASLNRLGYGHAFHGGRVDKAHRVAWKIERGTIPDGMCVCHTCDVRSCVRPDHLFLGTQVENIADMKSKGRGRTNDKRGTGNSSCKLTEDQVREIRTLYAARHSRPGIAQRFGVSVGTVNDIGRGKRWKHLPHEATTQQQAGDIARAYEAERARRQAERAAKSGGRP